MLAPAVHLFVLLIFSISFIICNSNSETDNDVEGKELYNGIVLPKEWPPNYGPSDYGKYNRQPMPVPYLDAPPVVIPIDVGRQLFVDDFLIKQTTLQRTFHLAEFLPEICPIHVCV